MRVPEILDNEGNIIPPPAGDHPVNALIYLLEYGRRQGFKIGPTVQIGDLVVQVADIRQARNEAGDDRPAERDVWEEHGHVEVQQ